MLTYPNINCPTKNAREEAHLWFDPEQVITFYHKSPPSILIFISLPPQPHHLWPFKIPNLHPSCLISSWFVLYFPLCCNCLWRCWQRWEEKGDTWSPCPWLVSFLRPLCDRWSDSSDTQLPYPTVCCVCSAIRPLPDIAIFEIDQTETIHVSVGKLIPAWYTCTDTSSGYNRQVCVHNWTGTHF